MLCKIIKACFFAFLCFGSFASSSNSPIDEKNKQLCYLKDKYINENIYSYNNRNFSFQNEDSFSNSFSSIIIARREAFVKSPWELKGVRVEISPSSRNPSITHWFKYSSRKNKLDKLCKMREGECIFKVVYRGDFYPKVNSRGSQAIYYKNKMKAVIHDGQNNILRFPKNCSKLNL